MKIIVSGYFGSSPSIIDSVVDAITRLGHEVKRHEIYAPSLTYTCGYERKKILPRLPGHLDRSYKKLEKLICDFKPEIVFILRGDELDVSSLNELKNRFGFSVWQWIYDPIAKVPGTLDLAKISDRIFHFSALETLRLKEMLPTKSVEFLPGAFDDRFHDFSAEQKQAIKRFDIFFCGALYPPAYRNRLDLLNYLSKADTDHTILVLYKPSTFSFTKNNHFRRILKHQYPNLHQNWRLRGLNRKQMIAYYHQSVINLSLHDLNAPGVGISWRTFEILGSGGTMISDRHPELESCFGNEVPFEVFDRAEDILDITSEIKANPDKVTSLRQKARSVAYLHSYYHRMQTILPPESTGN